MEASTTSRADSGELRNYHYRFEFESEEQRRRFSREAERVRDQRTASRVKPSTAEPVVVRVRLTGQPPSKSGPQADDFEAMGNLKNISTGGAAVLVERAAEIVLATTDVVEVSFRLPQGSETLQLRGWIRHRELRGDLICVTGWNSILRTLRISRSNSMR